MLDQQTIKVTALKKEATSEDASKVINAVKNLIDETYQVEVKFIQE